MTGIRADRLFFYLLLLLATIITLTLIWTYIGPVVLAITVAVVLQPMHGWFLERSGGRKGPATAMTLMTTLLLVVIPVLVGTWLLLGSFVALSTDVSNTMQEQEPVWIATLQNVETRLASTELAQRLQIENGQIADSIHNLARSLGFSLVNWLTNTGLSIFNPELALRAERTE